MPALPAVPNVLRADVNWTISSDTNAMTRLFFSYAGAAPNSAACQAFALTIGDAFQTYTEYIDVDTTLVGATVTDLSSDTGSTGTHDLNTGGTRAGPISGASAVLVNYQIDRRYRGGKPRSYLPWGAAGDIGNRQTWAAVFISEVNTALADVFAHIIGATSGGTTIQQHVNVSYYHGFTVVTNPISGRARNVPTLRSSPRVDTIVSFAVSTRIANQRRRG